MGKNKILLLAAVAVFAAVAIFTQGFGLFSDKDDGTLRLYGNVDIREVDMAFRTSGRIATIAVEEGDRVAKGQTLAALDDRPTRDRTREAAARVAEARANLAELQSGNRPQDIARARANVAEAAARADNASADYRRREGLVAEGAISRDLWDQTRATLKTAQAQLTAAQQSLSLQQAGARKENIAASQARLEAALAQQQSAGTDLDDNRLTAAVAGTVVTRAVEPGDIVQNGETAFTIAIDKPVRVRAYVAEPDLPRIRPGMRVRVSADGTEKSYAGTIGYISPRAEFTPKSVETESLRTDLVYQLRITIEKPDGTLRQGQPVTVIIANPLAATRN